MVMRPSLKASASIYYPPHESRLLRLIAVTTPPTAGRGWGAGGARRPADRLAARRAESTIRIDEQRHCFCQDVSCGRRTPVARVPAAFVICMQPDRAARYAEMPQLPRHQGASNAVDGERLTISQKTAVDAHTAWRDGNIVAGNGGDHFQKWLAFLRTLSARNEATAPAELSCSRWRAYRNEH